ncbi:MAG TPA: hypothetical protein VGM88_08665 [Kofleriaceae bacterium]|jgi:hypothetical protein
MEAEQIVRWSLVTTVLGGTAAFLVATHRPDDGSGKDAVHRARVEARQTANDADRAKRCARGPFVSEALAQSRGPHVRDCDLAAEETSPQQLSERLACAADAQAKHEPFVMSADFVFVDTGRELGLLGRSDASGYHVYVLNRYSGCPRLQVQGCASLAIRADQRCEWGKDDCYRCDQPYEADPTAWGAAPR